MILIKTKQIRRLKKLYILLVFDQFVYNLQ